MYMSYCRFEGTRYELQKCLDEAQEHFNGEAEYPVSDREINEFRLMVSEFFDFLADNRLIDNYGDFRYKKFDTLCETLRERSEDDDDE